METTVPTETVTKVIEVVEQMDYTEYLVKLVNSNELILDAVHVLCPVRNCRLPLLLLL